MKMQVKPKFWLSAIKIARKAILYAKGGYTKAERQDLAEELLELAADILGDVAEDLGDG